MITFDSGSVEETHRLGRRLAGLLQPGDIVLLEGRLGSGKTLLVSGIADGLGVDETVTSPSFVLVHEYSGFLDIVHADLYRLGSVNEFEDLELPTTASDGVLVVEWGGVVSGSVPDHLLVRIEITGETSRTLSFVPVGSWRSRSLEELSG